jgi:hypothetical protein
MNFTTKRMTVKEFENSDLFDDMGIEDLLAGVRLRPGVLEIALMSLS